MPNEVGDLSERELIQRIQRQLLPPPPWLLVGIGDDAAVVEPVRGRVEVLTTDAVVEGVHFDRRFTPPAAIGHRALAVNLSDLAAMGAAPRLALLSLVLPGGLPCGELDAMVSGLAAQAASHRVHVVGGNLTRSPGPLMIDLTLAGSVKRRQALTRSGARPGDEIYVTGTLGAAAAGLEQLAAGGAVDEGCARRYLYPEARVRAGLLLARNRAASSCIDLSDGAADGLRRIAEASGVGIRVDAPLLPVDEEACRWFTSRCVDPVEATLQSGDDYELLFTVRPRLRHRLAAVHRHGGVALTRIGVCTDTPEEMVWRRSAGDPASDRPLPAGYSHFR
jgi:thiamine-monophosphate kinase